MPHRHPLWYLIGTYPCVPPLLPVHGKGPSQALPSRESPIYKTVLLHINQLSVCMAESQSPRFTVNTINHLSGKTDEVLDLLLYILQSSGHMATKSYGWESQKTGLPHLSPNTPAVATSPIPSRLSAKTRTETSQSHNTSSFQLLVYGFQWHNGCYSQVAFLIISWHVYYHHLYYLHTACTFLTTYL